MFGQSLVINCKLNLMQCQLLYVGFISFFGRKYCTELSLVTSGLRCLSAQVKDVNVPELLKSHNVKVQTKGVYSVLLIRNMPHRNHHKDIRF